MPSFSAFRTTEDPVDRFKRGRHLNYDSLRLLCDGGDSLMHIHTCDAIMVYDPGTKQCKVGHLYLLTVFLVRCRISHLHRGLPCYLVRVSPSFTPTSRHIHRHIRVSVRRSLRNGSCQPYIIHARPRTPEGLPTGGM